MCPRWPLRRGLWQARGRVDLRQGRAQLEDVLRRLGTLAEDLPQVVEMDCNPVKVSVFDAIIVDARIRVAPAEAPRPLGARR